MGRKKNWDARNCISHARYNSLNHLGKHVNADAFLLADIVGCKAQS